MKPNVHSSNFCLLPCTSRYASFLPTFSLLCLAFIMYLRYFGQPSAASWCWKTFACRSRLWSPYTRKFDKKSPGLLIHSKHAAYQPRIDVCVRGQMSRTRTVINCSFSFAPYEICWTIKNQNSAPFPLEYYCLNSEKHGHHFDTEYERCTKKRPVPDDCSGYLC